MFDQFLDCPKPIIIGANGPAIGACVTSATLCDAIVASEQATFLTPFARLVVTSKLSLVTYFGVKFITFTAVVNFIRFIICNLIVMVTFARLGVPPEGCSSVHFARIMGEANAERMLGKEGWKPIAHEAKEVGLIKEVVPHDRLLDRSVPSKLKGRAEVVNVDFLKPSVEPSDFVRCQALGEEWAKAGKVREIPGGGSVEEYKEVNRKESLDLADAFLSTKFVNSFSLCDFFYMTNSLFCLF